MIGWKCDYGYVTTPYNLTKLSDINFTDINKICSFPTGIGEFTSFSNTTAINRTNGNNFSNVQELAVALNNLLLNDYSSLYLVPTVGSGDLLYDDISPIIPSAYLMCPNLLEYKKTTGAGYGVIYIKGLKRILILGDGTTYLYSVNGDDITRVDPTMTRKYYPPGAMCGVNPFDRLQITASIPVFSHFDGTPESLYTPPFTMVQVRSTRNSDYQPGYLVNSGDVAEIRNFYQVLFQDYVDPDFDIPDNPYDPGGPSGPTDPDIPPGTFDDDSDPIPDSPLPTLSAANTGFTRIYNPTLSQVQQLAQYLWTTPDVIETIWNHIKQFFENPMDAIIGFNLVPVPVPDGGTEDFALMFIKTGVMMTVAANQFVDLDCGTLELKRYYGSALDQSPYTKVSCFLPYIGTVNLNTDEVMGTTLQVKYRVDIVSGSCVAKIFVDGNCLYQYSGHCAITIPISSADFSSYVSAAISVGKLAAAAITAGAGAAAAVAVGEASQQTNQVVTTTQTTNTARNPATGRQITTGTVTTVQTRESPADQSSTQASFSGLSPQNIANTVGAIMSSKPHIEHSGSFSGNSGYLGVRRPFVIIERPNMCMPANYQALNGFPSMITMELSTCKGFTRIQQVQLTGLHATNPEQAEILELLKSGVIL